MYSMQHVMKLHKSLRLCSKHRIHYASFLTCMATIRVKKVHAVEANDFARSGMHGYVVWSHSLSM